MNVHYGCLTFVKILRRRNSADSIQDAPMNNRDAEATLQLHGRVLSEMVSEIGKAAASQMPDWRAVLFDHREARSGGSGISRTVAVNENGRSWIEDSVKLYNLLECMLEVRDGLESGHWYGLLIVIKRSGEVDVKYNYDCDCIETFDDDEENHIPF
jgi:hypothetical protein